MRPRSATLAAWPETRILRAMHAWRRGIVATLPWFRATPFAAANHYRDRSLDLTVPRATPAALALARSLPAWDRASFWVIDADAATALWLGMLLRRQRGLAWALAFNGWYDVDGALDGRDAIPLLLALAERPLGAVRGEAGLLCERERVSAAAGAQRLDNRYHLGEEELPSRDQLRQLGRRRVRVFTSGELAPDLAEWMDALRGALVVDVVTSLPARAA